MSNVNVGSPVNPLILDRLKEYDKDVCELAVAAIEHSEHSSASAVADHMLALIRRRVRVAGELQ